MRSPLCLLRTSRDVLFMLVFVPVGMTSTFIDLGLDLGLSLQTILELG